MAGSMRELRGKEYKDILHLIEVAHAARDRAAMFQAICERFEMIIGISSAVWLPIDGQTRQYVFQEQMHFRAPAQPGLLWCAHYAPQHPLVLSRHLQHDMQVFKITDAISARKLAETEYGKEFQPLTPLFYEMPANLRWHGDPIATLSLHRQKKDGDFSERHRLIFQVLLPHLASAAHTLDLRASLAQTHHKGVVLQAGDGSIELLNNEARQAFDGLSPHKITLPDQCTEQVHLRLGMRDYRVRSIPLRFGSRGKIFVLEATSGAEVVDFTAYGLTKREREIAMLVIDGRSNREIAEQLRMAEQTVKDHLHHVFAKMKIRRRSELAAIALRLRP
jgi:DNA-binding CsgD family transcriptional regulator